MGRIISKRLSNSGLLDKPKVRIVQWIRPRVKPLYKLHLRRMFGLDLALKVLVRWPEKLHILLGLDP